MLIRTIEIGKWRNESGEFTIGDVTFCCRDWQAQFFVPIDEGVDGVEA